MDDVTKLGPLWVSQLRREVQARRNRADENLLCINPDGAFAEQHRMLISAADVMLAGPDLLAALKEFVHPHQSLPLTEGERRDMALAAIAKATGSAA